MVGRSFKFDALWSKSLLSNLTCHVLCESEARSSTDITTWNSTSSNRNLLFRFKRVFCMCATPNQLAYMNKSLFFSPYFVIVISSFPFSSVFFLFCSLPVISFFVKIDPTSLSSNGNICCCSRKWFAKKLPELRVTNLMLLDVKRVPNF